MSTIEIIEPEQEPEGIFFKDMPIESYGEITTPGNYHKYVVFKIEQDWVVSVNNKESWAYLGNISLRVRLLPKGTKILIKV